jgi:hypothetical protein
MFEPDNSLRSGCLPLPHAAASRVYGMMVRFLLDVSISIYLIFTVTQNQSLHTDERLFEQGFFAEGL